MKLPPIITSLLDIDLYKLTMLQAFLHQGEGKRIVRYAFKCRNEGITWTPGMATEILGQLEHLCTLRFTEPELSYLATLPYLKPDFIAYLRYFQFDLDHIYTFSFSDPDGYGPRIEFQGPLCKVSPFETFALAIVNEVYFNFSLTSSDLYSIEKAGLGALRAKIDFAQDFPFKFFEFGTRRRFSKEWQDLVVSNLTKELPKTTFAGTSNVKLAMDYGITPVGTMAHEFIQLYQVARKGYLKDSQKDALQAWVDEYRGDLGIALSDTLGTDKFLKDFDMYFAKLYDGVRHDSGEPEEWGERMLVMYQEFGIDPMSKKMIFSDGLDFQKARRLHLRFNRDTQVSFGIGTHLTNDFPGLAPLNIVIKLVEVDGRPVAKLSDSPGKTMCENQDYLDHLKKVCEE